MQHTFFIIPKWLFISFLAFSFLNCFSQINDAELINQQTTIEISDGRLKQSNFYEIRINSRNGDKYAEVFIPFNKMSKVYNIEASVTDNSGKVVKKLKKNDIIETSISSDMTIFQDNYVKEFALRNHTYPYTLTYSYQLDANQFMFITSWDPVIDYDIPTLRASLKIITPDGYRIAYNSNLTDKPKIDSMPGKVFYTWHASYLKQLLPETWAPPLQQYAPSVEVVPEKFIFEREGSNKSWISFGNWHLSLHEGLNDLPEKEKSYIHYLTDSITDEKEKIRKVFHYLQDATRYINVSIKTGGMKPFPASYVAEKKYGDCKALANYFKSCLSVINIESFYTVINADDVIEPINTSFPSQQFNHVIVCIPLRKDTLWVDCTSDLAFGYLGTFTQNRPALVLKNNASALIMTPALTFDEVLKTRKISARINADKTVTADFTNTFKGYNYEFISGIMKSWSENERQQYLRMKLVASGFQLDTYSLSVPGRDIPEIELKYSASAAGVLKDYGTESLLKVIPMEMTILEEPRKRKLPVKINFPVYQVDSIEYTIPGNYKISAIPKNISFISGYGEYLADFQVKGNMILVIKHLKINSGTYPLDEYEKFYSFIKSISELENTFYLSLTNN